MMKIAICRYPRLVPGTRVAMSAFRAIRPDCRSHNRYQTKLPADSIGSKLASGLSSALRLLAEGQFRAGTIRLDGAVFGNRAARCDRVIGYPSHPIPHALRRGAAT